MKADPDQSSRVYPPPHSLPLFMPHHFKLNISLNTFSYSTHRIFSSIQFHQLTSDHTCPLFWCPVGWDEGRVYLSPGRHCSVLTKWAPSASARAAATSWLTEFNWQEGKGYGLRDVTAPTVQSFPHQAIEVSSVAACYEIRCRLCKNKMMIINIHHVN